MTRKIKAAELTHVLGTTARARGMTEVARVCTALR